MAACEDIGKTIPEAAPTPIANIRLLSICLTPSRQLIALTTPTISRMRRRGKWQDYTEIARGMGKKKGAIGSPSSVNALPISSR